MSILSEFREFIARGNVIDLAVGVVIGGAFGKIVTSLVGDLIMPPIGLLMGGVDFTNLRIVIKAADPAHKVSRGGDPLRRLPQHHSAVPDRRGRRSS